MSTTRTLSALAAALALGLAGAVTAQVQTRPMDTGETTDLTKVDANADGKISKDEASANSKLASQFNKLDMNKDQSLDTAEFSRFEVGGSATPSAPTTSPEKATPSDQPKP